MSEESRCAHCRCLFRPNPHVKEQRYCSEKGCQRARKTSWQREKMRKDPHYQANHKLAQSEWLARNPDYSRRYRAAHPEYVARNRLLQKGRDAERRKRHLAKKDASSGKRHIETGTYLLVPSGLADLAKMDACGQKVLIISEGCEAPGAFLQSTTQVTRSPLGP